MESQEHSSDGRQTCPKCNKDVADLQKHMDKECSYRTIICKHCGLSRAAKYFEDHKSAEYCLQHQFDQLKKKVEDTIEKQLDTVTQDQRRIIDQIERTLKTLVPPQVEIQAQKIPPKITETVQTLDRLLVMLQELTEATCAIEEKLESASATNQVGELSQIKSCHSLLEHLISLQSVLNKTIEEMRENELFNTKLKQCLQIAHTLFKHISKDDPGMMWKLLLRLSSISSHCFNDQVMPVVVMMPELSKKMGNSEPWYSTPFFAFERGYDSLC